jgi:aryl-alcohol dehydrogenase-like predicted oxidoreductase
MIEAFDYAKKHGLAGFVANQPMWSLAAPNATNLPMPGLVVFDPPAHSFHQQTGIAVVPYSSQAQGFFTKMEQKGVTGLPAAARKIYVNETNVGRFETARRLALKYEVPVAHIVLSYLISQPFTTIPVVGCRTLAQLTESMQAIDLRLEPEELRFLEEGHLF